jgi:hypothetical protein
MYPISPFHSLAGGPAVIKHGWRSSSNDYTVRGLDQSACKLPSWVMMSCRRRVPLQEGQPCIQHQAKRLCHQAPLRRFGWQNNAEQVLPACDARITRVARPCKPRIHQCRPRLRPGDGQESTMLPAPRHWRRGRRLPLRRRCNAGASTGADSQLSDDEGYGLGFDPEAGLTSSDAWLGQRTPESRIAGLDASDDIWNHEGI